MASASDARSVIIQGDGKIVVAGYTGSSDHHDFVVARYKSDGSLDNSFSDDGIQITYLGNDDIARAAGLQTDGKIVLGGYTFNNSNENRLDFALVRYNIDGTLDNSFSGDGIQTYDLHIDDGESDYHTSDEINSLAIQADGKIVVAGGRNDQNRGQVFILARYNSDGNIDSTFSGDGVAPPLIFESASSVAIQSDGKIVVAGGEGFALARYNSDGSIDNTFSGDGLVKTDVTEGSDGISSIAIFRDKLYAVGIGNFEMPQGVVTRYLLDDNSQNKAPLVTLSIPSNQTTYPGPAKIYLTATATDADGIIKKVQFYNGSTLLHTEHEYPYGFTWYNVPIGNYTITAKAMDNDSNVTTSNSINISVVANKAPTVNLILPASDVSYGSPASVYLSAKANDEDGYIKNVQFYNGAALLNTQYAAPYGYLWKDVPAGNYTITAKATDNSGLSTTSSSVHVSIVNSATPTADITSPADNSVFASNASIKINATASDPDGVSKVEFYNGTVLLHTEYQVAYTYNWNNVSTGNYTLTVKSVNKNGVVTTSNSVHVSVIDNTAPTVNITTPLNNKVFQGPAVIGLAANAKDNDGTISKVEFYRDGNLLTTEHSYPYTFLWRDVQPGTYTITAKATDNSGAITTSGNVTITVTGEAATFAASKVIAVNTPTVSKAITNKPDLSNELLSLKLSPNPVHNTLHVSINGQQNKTSELYILSASGVVIKNIHSLTSSEVPLDVSSLINGVYFIKIISGDKVMYKRFVKL